MTRERNSQPRQDLGLLIDLVNTEHLYERLQGDLNEKFWAARDDPKNASIAHRALWVKVCEETAKQLHAQTRKFVGPASEFQHFVERYEQLGSAAKILLAIAKRKATSHNKKSSELTIHDHQWPVDLPFTVSIDLVVNERGQLAVTKNQLLDAFVGVPVQRIRSCAICKRIFWAPRINSECCSEQCRKTYNQRNSRANRQLRRRLKPGTEQSRKGRKAE